ncbi:MAG: hypothetical protein AAFO87_17075 [Cyanobacteria bacterium J06607_6]
MSLSMLSQLTERSEQSGFNTADDWQLALAIANESVLRSLLCDCTPALVTPEAVDRVSVHIGVPIAGGTVDASLQFERVHCVLAEQSDCALVPGRQVTYQSGLQTLVERVRPQDAIALLAHVGFSPRQISQLMHLPSQAWHKSWWRQVGAGASCFQRWMRLRCYANGTITLQYQDYFSQDRPPCFYARSESIPVLVRRPQASFADTLGRLNRTRAALQTAHIVLICDALSEIETEAFIRQNVSLYQLSAMGSG